MFCFALNTEGKIVKVDNNSDVRKALKEIEKTEGLLDLTPNAEKIYEYLTAEGTVFSNKYLAQFDANELAFYTDLQASLLIGDNVITDINSKVGNEGLTLELILEDGSSVDVVMADVIDLVLSIAQADKLVSAWSSAGVKNLPKKVVDSITLKVSRDLNKYDELIKLIPESLGGTFAAERISLVYTNSGLPEGNGYKAGKSENPKIVTAEIPTNIPQNSTMWKEILSLITKNLPNTDSLKKELNEFRNVTPNSFNFKEGLMSILAKHDSFIVLTFNTAAQLKLFKKSCEEVNSLINSVVNLDGGQPKDLYDGRIKNNLVLDGEVPRKELMKFINDLILLNESKYRGKFTAFINSLRELGSGRDLSISSINKIMPTYYSLVDLLSDYYDENTYAKHALANSTEDELINHAAITTNLYPTKQLNNVYRVKSDGENPEYYEVLSTIGADPSYQSNMFSEIASGKLLFLAVHADDEFKIEALKQNHIEDTNPDKPEHFTVKLKDTDPESPAYGLTMGVLLTGETVSSTDDRLPKFYKDLSGFKFYKIVKGTINLNTVGSLDSSLLLNTNLLSLVGKFGSGDNVKQVYVTTTTNIEYDGTPVNSITEDVVKGNSRAIRVNVDVLNRGINEFNSGRTVFITKSIGVHKLRLGIGPSEVVTRDWLLTLAVNVQSKLIDNLSGTNSDTDYNVLLGEVMLVMTDNHSKTIASNNISPDFVTRYNGKYYYYFYDSNIVATSVDNVSNSQIENIEVSSYLVINSLIHNDGTESDEIKKIKDEVKNNTLVLVSYPNSANVLDTVYITGEKIASKSEGGESVNNDLYQFFVLDSPYMRVVDADIVNYVLQLAMYDSKFRNAYKYDQITVGTRSGSSITMPQTTIAKTLDTLQKSNLSESLAEFVNKINENKLDIVVQAHYAEFEKISKLVVPMVDSLGEAVPDGIKKYIKHKFSHLYPKNNPYAVTEYVINNFSEETTVNKLIIEAVRKLEESDYSIDDFINDLLLLNEFGYEYSNDVNEPQIDVDKTYKTYIGSEVLSPDGPFPATDTEEVATHTVWPHLDDIHRDLIRRNLRLDLINAVLFTKDKTKGGEEIYREVSSSDVGYNIANIFNAYAEKVVKTLDEQHNGDFKDVISNILSLYSEFNPLITLKNILDTELLTKTIDEVLLTLQSENITAYKTVYSNLQVMKYFKGTVEDLAGKYIKFTEDGAVLHDRFTSPENWGDRLRSADELTKSRRIELFINSIPIFIGSDLTFSTQLFYRTQTEIFNILFKDVLNEDGRTKSFNKNDLWIKPFETLRNIYKYLNEVYDNPRSSLVSGYSSTPESLKNNIKLVRQMLSILKPLYDITDNFKEGSDSPLFHEWLFTTRSVINEMFTTNLNVLKVVEDLYSPKATDKRVSKTVSENVAYNKAFYLKYNPTFHDNVELDSPVIQFTIGENTYILGTTYAWSDSEKQIMVDPGSELPDGTPLNIVNELSEVNLFDKIFGDSSDTEFIKMFKHLFKLNSTEFLSVARALRNADEDLQAEVLQGIVNALVSNSYSNATDLERVIIKNRFITTYDGGNTIFPIFNQADDLINVLNIDEVDKFSSILLSNKEVVLSQSLMIGNSTIPGNINPLFIRRLTELYELSEDENIPEYKLHTLKAINDGRLKIVAESSITGRKNLVLKQRNTNTREYLLHDLLVSINTADFWGRYKHYVFADRHLQPYTAISPDYTIYTSDSANIKFYEADVNDLYDAASYVVLENTLHVVENSILLFSKYLEEIGKPIKEDFSKFTGVQKILEKYKKVFESLNKLGEYGNGLTENDLTLFISKLPISRHKEFLFVKGSHYTTDKDGVIKPNILLLEELNRFVEAKSIKGYAEWVQENLEADAAKLIIKERASFDMQSSSNLLNYVEENFPTDDVSDWKDPASDKIKLIKVFDKSGEEILDSEWIGKLNTIILNMFSIGSKKKNPEYKFKLNPIVTQFLARNYYAAEIMRPLFIGGQAQALTSYDSRYESVDKKKAIRDSKKKSMDTNIKRAMVATTTVLPPQVHHKNGLPLFQNVAIVTDYKNPMLSITGRSADLESTDGLSFVPYEMLVMQNISYPGQTEVEGNSKTAYTVSIPGASSSMIIKHSLATVSNSFALNMSGKHKGSLTADAWYRKIFDHIPYDDNGNEIKFTKDLADTINAAIQSFGKSVLFTETETVEGNKTVERIKKLVKVEYSEDAFDGKGGFIATYENIAYDGTENVEEVYTKELEIKTNYDIRQKLLGGEKSVGIDNNGKMVYNEDTSYLMVDIMSNYNYTTETAEGETITTKQPLKQAMIHMLSFGSAVKLSPVNTNTYDSFTDTESKLATVRINSLHGGKILDTAYDYEGGEVNGITQAINACVQGIYNHGDADAMFSALGELIEARINELINYSDIAQSKELTAELMLKLNNAFIKLLRDKVEAGMDSALDLDGISLLNAIMDNIKDRYEKGLDTKLPIDNPNVFYAWFSALIKFVNDDAIKNTFPGALYVLTAHFGMNEVYDTPDGTKTREDMYLEYLRSGGLKPHPDVIIRELQDPPILGLDPNKFPQEQFDELSLVKVGDTLVFQINSDGVNEAKTVYAYVDAYSSKNMVTQLKAAEKNSTINISLADVVDFKYSGVNSNGYELIQLVYRDKSAGRALRGGEVEVEFKENGYIQTENGITVKSLVDLDLPSIQCIQRVRLLRELFTSEDPDKKAEPYFINNILTGIDTKGLTQSELYLVDNFMITVNLLRKFVGKYGSDGNPGISIDVLTAGKFNLADSDSIEDWIIKVSNTATPIMMGLMVGKSIDLNTIDCIGPSTVLPAQLLPKNLRQTVVTKELTKPSTIREVEVMMDSFNKNLFNIRPGMTIGDILNKNNLHFKELVKNLKEPSELFSESGYVAYLPFTDKQSLVVLTESQLKKISDTLLNVYTPIVKEDPINVAKLIVVDKYGNPIIRYDSSYLYYKVAGNLIAVVPDSVLDNQEELDDCISSMDQGVKHSSLDISLGSVAETVFLNNGVSYGIKFEEALNLNEDEMVLKLRSSFELMLTNVGVRTPSQTLASSTVIKIVSFTNSRTNLVRVPLTLTWYQGADYDIDKMTVVGVPLSKRGLVEPYSPLFDYSNVDRLKMSIQLPVPDNKTYTKVDGNVLFVNEEATGLYALPSYYNLLVDSKEKLLERIKEDYNAFYALTQLINEVYAGYNIHFKEGTPKQLLILSDIIKEHSDFRLSRRGKHQALKTAIFGKLMWINSSAANKVYATSSVEVDEKKAYLEKNSNKANIKQTDMRLFSHMLQAYAKVSNGAEGIGIGAVGMKTATIIALYLNKLLRRELIDSEKNPELAKALRILGVSGSPAGVNLDLMSRLVAINPIGGEDVDAGNSSFDGELAENKRQQEVEELFNDNPENDEDGSLEYVAFEPEQIHILGSKADIQGFKEFVQKDNNQSQNTSILSSFNNIPIIDTEDITTYKGTKGAAQYDKKNNEIKVNRNFLKKKFNEKAWTKPRKLLETLHGEQVESYAQALPENQFKTYEEWEQFVISHEYQHSLYSRQDFNKDFPNGTKGEYESEINRRALNQITSENIKGIDISSYSKDKLGKDLTNVHYAKNGKSEFDITPSDKTLTLTVTAKKTWGESVEAWYKSNNAETKGIPEGKEGDEYDFRLMVGLITDKLKQYPNLIKQINERGGREFIKKSTHNIGNRRWSSKNPKNMFIRSLLQAYDNVISTQQNNTNQTSQPFHTNKNLRSPVGNALKAYFDSNGNDIFSEASAYMTMAVDNVKEAMLYMINASKDILGTIMAANTLNVSFEKIVDIMNSKAVDGALKLAQLSQLFENYNVPLSGLYEFIVGVPKLSSVGLGSLSFILSNYFKGVNINDRELLVTLYKNLRKDLMDGGVNQIRKKVIEKIKNSGQNTDEDAQARLLAEDMMFDDMALEMMLGNSKKSKHKPTKIGRDMLTYVDLLIQRAAFLETIFDENTLKEVKAQTFKDFSTSLTDIEISEGIKISEDLDGLKELFVFQQLYKFGQIFTFLSQHGSLNGGLKGTLEDMVNFVDRLNQVLNEITGKSVNEAEDLISKIVLNDKSTYEGFDMNLALPVYQILAQHPQYKRMFELFLGVLNVMNRNSMRVNLMNQLKSKWGSVFGNSQRAITITNDIISNSMITTFLATLNISFKNSSGVKVNGLSNVDNILQFIDLFHDEIYPSVAMRGNLMDNEFFRNVIMKKYSSDTGVKMSKLEPNINLSEAARSGIGSQLPIKIGYDEVKNLEITDDKAVYLDGKKLTFGETLELYSLLMDKAKYSKSALTTLFGNSVGKQFSIQSRYMQFMATNSINPESLVSDNNVRDWEELTPFEQNFLILNAVNTTIGNITNRKAYGYVQKVLDYKSGTVQYYYNQNPIYGLHSNLFKWPFSDGTFISYKDLSSHIKERLILALEDSLTSNRISFKIVEC